MSNSFNDVLKCQDCCEDQYEQEYKDCIEFIEKNSYPNRIYSLVNSENRQEEKKKIRNKAKNYNIKYCQNGVKHLYHLDKKVLMVNQAYKLANQLHSDKHIQPQEMIEKIKELPVYLQNIIGFIQEFNIFCPYCYHRNPKLKDKQFKDPIWKILASKFNINVRTVSNRSTIHNILGKYDSDLCEGSCLDDYYDRNFQICLFMIRNKKFPPLPRGQGTHRKRFFYYRTAKKLKIKICNLGKDHLWLKSQDLRIPMVGESRYFALMCHGEQHHNKTKMKQLVLQQNRIYPFQMKKYINGVIQECLQCTMKPTCPQRMEKQFKIQEGRDVDPKRLTKREFSRISELGRGEKQIIKKKMKLGQSILANPERIYDKVNSVSIWDDVMKIHGQLMSQYRLSSLAAEMAIEDLHWSRSEQPLLEEKLAERPEIIYRTFQQKRIKKVSFISTVTMKKNYEQFGECLFIDYTRNIMRKRDPSGRHYHVGFFSGQNKQGKIVLFGISLLSSELFFYHQKAVEMFFEMMGNRISNCLVASDSRQLFQGLVKLKKQKNYRYCIFINWHYIIEFLKVQTSFELEKGQVMKMYCEAMSSLSRGRYQKWMIELRTQIVGTDLFLEFDKIGEVFSLCKIYPAFVGFGIGSKRIQNLFELLENRLQYHPKLAMFFSNIFQIEKYLHEKEKARPTPFRGESPISYLSHIVHEQIFSVLQKSYEDSKEFFKIEENTVEVKIQDSQKCEFTLKYMLQRRHWKCNCRQIHFTGLPCSHIIYVVMKNGGCLQYYINSRWLYEIEQVHNVEENEEELLSILRRVDEEEKVKLKNEKMIL